MQIGQPKANISYWKSKHMVAQIIYVTHFHIIYLHFNHAEEVNNLPTHTEITEHTIYALSTDSASF